MVVVDNVPSKGVVAIASSDNTCEHFATANVGGELADVADGVYGRLRLRGTKGVAVEVQRRKKVGWGHLDLACCFCGSVKSEKPPRSRRRGDGESWRW